MMPISRHFYPKCKKGPKMLQHVKKFVLASLPPCQALMNLAQASQSWLISMWTTSHAGNQLSMDEIFSHCDQMPQEVLCEDDGSPNDDNDTDDERITPLRMKVNKIEVCLTHAMNATINIIWWLNIWQCSEWCSNSSFNLLIGAACQMQPWVSLLTFLIILSMYLPINVTLLSCTMNKERLKIYK